MDDSDRTEPTTPEPSEEWIQDLQDTLRMSPKDFTSRPDAADATKVFEAEFRQLLIDARNDVRALTRELRMTEDALLSARFEHLVTHADFDWLWDQVVRGFTRESKQVFGRAKLRGEDILELPKPSDPTVWAKRAVYLDLIREAGRNHGLDTGSGTAKDGRGSAVCLSHSPFRICRPWSSIWLHHQPWQS